MIDFLSQYLCGKNVLILGFGREGRSTFKLLEKVDTIKKIGISDLNPIKDSLSSDIFLHTGEGYLDVLDDYDVVFKSPGVVLPKDINEYSCIFTSQTEVFLKVYREHTIGITGTKGKSTTSSLLYHTLCNCGKDTLFAGNIGVPIFDIYQQIGKDTIVIFEMSCHQLEYLSVSPSVAVFLNLYEDHLDHYGSFEKYANVKKNIYRFQSERDILLCSSQFIPDANECKCDVVEISAHILPDNISDYTTLKGEHNLLNTAFVYYICRKFGIKDEDFLCAISSFPPLKHRLEFVGNIDGVDYYNDSISTTCESAISAVKSISNAGVLLVGGMDRGINYSVLIDSLLVSKLDTVILMYESGKRILSELDSVDYDKSSAPDFVYVPDLESAVKYAKDNTQKGKACILSPASASYGYFKNFEQRGEVFCKLVLGE